MRWSYSYQMNLLEVSRGRTVVFVITCIVFELALCTCVVNIYPFISFCVTEVLFLDSLLPACIKDLHRQHSQLVPWEQRLVSAQNVLFNEELFAQVRNYRHCACVRVRLIVTHSYCLSLLIGQYCCLLSHTSLLKKLSIRSLIYKEKFSQTESIFLLVDKLIISV